MVRALYVRWIIAFTFFAAFSATAAIFNVSGFFRSGALGDFSITGVTGSTDSTVDTYLAPDQQPTIHWQASSGATGYDVRIKDSTDTSTLCGPITNVTGTSLVVGCTLSHGLTYHAHVTAKRGATTKLASNDATFTFQVDTVVPVANSISGIRNGGTDVTNDAWLVGGNIATVVWNAFTNAGSYDVAITDSGGSTTICGPQNTASTSYTFTGCTLTNGTVYRAYVTAKSPVGGNQVAASNTGYSFTVDSTAPGAFSITGITGGSDSNVNATLSSGSEPTVNYGTSSNATSYDVTIKDSAGFSTLCTLNGDSASPSPVTSCGLLDGLDYKAYVTAKSASGLMTQTASNEPYSFTVAIPVVIPGDFMITGASGGGDLNPDSWLTAGTIVTANWQTAYGATSYNVVIRNAADTSDMCAQQNTTSSFYTFTGCNLTVGTQYRIKVTALGSSNVTALNNSFLFEVVSAGPGTFGITGVMGSNDFETDQYLTGGSVTPIIVFSPSSGATNYTVTIRNAADSADACAATTANSSPFTFTGCNLTLGANYRIRLAANNGAASTLAYNYGFVFYAANTATFCPTGTSTAKALTIYDSGGPSVNYAKNENCNFTISPSAGTAQILMNFAVFNSNDASDILTVYDGANTSGTNMGSFSNTFFEPDDIIATSGNMHMTWATNNSPTQIGYEMTYRVIYPDPGTFNITGITGGTDSTADRLLTNGVNPTVNWGASADASTYQVTIMDESGIHIVCPLATTASTSHAFSTCTLTTNMTYSVRLTALSVNSDYTQAANNYYRFSVGNKPGPFQILGVTGRDDVTNDQYLEDDGDPTINWIDSSLATTYDITLYESDGVTIKCGPFNIGAPVNTYTLTGCALNYGNNYKFQVIANNANGRTGALNNFYSLNVRTMWQPTAATSLANRKLHTAVWTGSEMIIWGGSGTGKYNNGAKYNPTTDSWVLTSTGANVPSARNYHTAVWTGSEMIIWGGSDAANTRVNTGGKYNPVGNSWTTTSVGTNVPVARIAHTGIWTGTEMIIWGGQDTANAKLNTGGRYTPGTDSWTLTSTGTNLPAGRAGHTAVWTGTQMIIWGDNGSGLEAGGRYTPGTDSWLAVSTGTFAPDIRYEHTAVWTGTEMIIWGGLPFDNVGGRYNPTTDTWQPTSVENMPPIAKKHSAVWTGTKMIVWGHSSGTGGITSNGGEYSPTTDTWMLTSTATNVPAPRGMHTAVWTGSQMIIWGGEYNQYNEYNSGGVYTPP